MNTDMINEMNEKRLERISNMERNLDDVNAVLDEGKDINQELRNKIRELAEYYECGEWLKDYEMDERGELPENLKRGVLSQDTLYELFERVNTYKKI